MAQLASPADPAGLAGAAAAGTGQGVIARGLGRSCNNAAQNDGGPCRGS